MTTKTNRRGEAMNRVQIGLTGIAGVILLVGLANIVIDKAKTDAAATAATTPSVPAEALAAPANAAGQPKEPLAELGVTPASDQATNAPAQAIPDLQPDPQLQRPMDRDPQAPVRPQQ